MPSAQADVGARNKIGTRADSIRGHRATRRYSPAANQPGDARAIKPSPYGKGFAAAFLLAVTSYGGGTRAQIPTARSPIANSGVGD